MLLHLLSIVVAVLPPIIVRRDAAGKLAIKIQVTGRPVRTLQRPATEALASSLGRVSRAVAPRKDKREQNGDPELCLLLDAHGAVLDPTLSALHAWSGAALLHVGAMSFDVLFEPAEIASLGLPAVVPFVGVPLTPSIETLGCDEKDCSLFWEILRPGATSNGWQHVGSAREYEPGGGDDGARLRVRAVPPASSRYAATAQPHLACVAEAAAPVEVPPLRPLLARRLRAMQHPTRHQATRDRAFRVLSYNLLADCYSRHWDEAGSVHSYCARRLTRAAHRMPRLLAEVLAFAPDVALLQEVDRSWFKHYWKPAMCQRGYAGVYLRKRSGSSSEGVAAFVRSSAFELVGVRDVGLALSPLDGAGALAPLLEFQTGTRDGVGKLPTVAQLLLLREVSARHASTRQPAAEAHTGRHVLVANTHLYFSNPAMHVRLLQTAKLLDQMHAWAAELRARLPQASAPALLVAGDLNSDASDAVIRLITRGSVEADDPDWLHGALNWAPSLDLTSAARDAAQAAAATLSVCAPGGVGWDTVCDADIEAAWAQQPGAMEVEDAVLLGGAVDATLDGARRIAREHGLLRLAVEALLARAPAKRKPEAETKPARQKRGRGEATEAIGGAAAAGGGSALTRLAAAIVSDAATGNSLANSRPLAAAEVARQLRLPLSLMAADAPAADGMQAMSWYTRAHTRLCQLMQLLLSAKVGLRSRVTSESGSELLAGGSDAEAAAHWAARAAGVRLQQPTPLQSAYDLDSSPTHVVPRYANSLDWICIDADQLEVVGVAPRPPLQELTRDVAMPSAEWPSDHVSLCCDLAWR